MRVPVRVLLRTGSSHVTWRQNTHVDRRPPTPPALSVRPGSTTRSTVQQARPPLAGRARDRIRKPTAMSRPSTACQARGDSGPNREGPALDGATSSCCSWRPGAGRRTRLPQYLSWQPAEPMRSRCSCRAAEPRLRRTRTRKASCQAGSRRTPMRWMSGCCGRRWWWRRGQPWRCRPAPRWKPPAFLVPRCRRTCSKRRILKQRRQLPRADTSNHDA
jgi:hypothetical protein